MGKLILLVGLGVGYVLGTRAGRERYEQMRNAALRVKDNPRVQKTTHQAVDLAKSSTQHAAQVARDRAPGATKKATDLAGSVAHKVNQKVRRTPADQRQADQPQADEPPAAQPPTEPPATS